LTEGDRAAIICPMKTHRFRALALEIPGVAVVALGLATSPGLGQDLSADVSVLIQTGFHDPGSSNAQPAGFEVFEGRLLVSGGRTGTFEYSAIVRYDAESQAMELFDVQATLPISPEVHLTAGMFRPSFGLDALDPKGQLRFLERASATRAIAPGRQVGVSLGGAFLDGRLEYGGGVFNGNGRTASNDGGYMWAGRVQFNTVGPIAFTDQFVLQGGLSVLWSDDVAGWGTGSTQSWGADFHAAYRGFNLTAEYLRAENQWEWNLDDHRGERTAEDRRDMQTTHGFHAEMARTVWGLTEAVVRYDSLEGADGETDGFLMAGLNLFPGYLTRLSLQYAKRLQGEDNRLLADGELFALVQFGF